METLSDKIINRGCHIPTEYVKQFIKDLKMSILKRADTKAEAPFMKLLCLSVVNEIERRAGDKLI